MNAPGPAREKLFTGRFLSLTREGRWEYAERVNATGAAIILAVTAEKNLLLVEQFRIPCHCRTIELPAGITGDEPGAVQESSAEAARRELLQETGYEAGKMDALMTGPASSGLTSELVTLFLASDLRKSAGEAAWPTRRSRFTRWVSKRFMTGLQPARQRAP